MRKSERGKKDSAKKRRNDEKKNVRTEGGWGDTKENRGGKNVTAVMGFAETRGDEVGDESFAIELTRKGGRNGCSREARDSRVDLLIWM